MKLTGIFVAVTTPYHKNILDENAFCRHISWLVDQGVQGIVPCGTTGESVALEAQEQKRLIQLCRDICQKKALVIPATGALTLEATLSLTRQAEELGADGALVITPYYIRMTPQALFRYYETLVAHTSLPVVLYHNPGRTNVTLGLEDIKKLATLPGIIGMKESCGDLMRPLTLSTCVPSSFSLLSGEDSLFFPFLIQGGEGIISVGANVAPALYGNFYKAWQNQNLPECLNLWKKISSLNNAFSGAPNPRPIRYACHKLGFGSLESRLPLAPLTTYHQEEIDHLLEVLDLYGSV